MLVDIQTAITAVQTLSVGIITAMTLAAVAVWGAYKAYSLFSGKGR